MNQAFSRQQNLRDLGQGVMEVGTVFRQMLGESLGLPRPWDRTNLSLLPPTPPSYSVLGVTIICPHFSCLHLHGGASLNKVSSGLPVTELPQEVPLRLEGSVDRKYMCVHPNSAQEPTLLNTHLPGSHIGYTGV